MNLENLRGKYIRPTRNYHTGSGYYKEDIENRIKRFIAKTVQKKNGCLEWIASKDMFGYGVFFSEHRKFVASRASYELFIGKIPKGMKVLHKCDNPPCVNPSHLFIGTQRDNVLDMNKKGRHHDCSGEQNPRSKISRKEVDLIRSLYVKNSKEFNATALAKRFSISTSAIYDVIKHRNWK